MMQTFFPIVAASCDEEEGRTEVGHRGVSTLVTQKNSKDERTHLDHGYVVFNGQWLFIFLRNKRR